MSEPSERAGAVPQPGRPVTVLVSSAGRRVELLRGFRRALASLGVDGRVIATEATWYSSAFHEADEGIVVPRLDDPAFVPTLLEVCEKHGVDLLVPTIDTEMAAWVGSRDEFAAIGTTISLSGGGVVDIAADKQLTHDWPVANGFPTVRQATPEAVLADPAAWTFPLVAKPRFGSAGRGVAIVRDADELAAAVRRPELGETVVQTLAGGRQYTIDVLADRAGRCVCVIPRRRIEVRSGEVSMGVTIVGILEERDAPPTPPRRSRMIRAFIGRASTGIPRRSMPRWSSWCCRPIVNAFRTCRSRLRPWSCRSSRRTSSGVPMRSRTV